ncbi:C-type lectin TsL [Octopus bimaculoides]|uniref:C-type lectin domain-containing protein n=1 Tax=Octopus bimaculoides TaxID=37653 RepID=A0A0L8G3A8_OCTBM|nr:C-type lectin TsL [Octopus bimaculoides]|eukprot:XP_014784594.1 PREDICTED: C-type lectin TsL-like [Octopus bimaculoides]
MQQLTYITLFLLSVTAAFGSWTSKNCTMYKGRCYTVFPVGKVNYIKAVNLCSQLPYGVPVILRSKAEDEFVRSLFPPRRAEFWIGMLTTQNVGGWTWITKEDTNWRNWMSGQYNDSTSEQCATSETVSSVSWRDQSCSSAYEVVCESRPNVACNCETKTTQATIYNVNRHGIVMGKRRCCCQKSEENSSFEKTPANDSTQYTIKTSLIQDSLIECSAKCVREFYCVAFSYNKTTKECAVLVSYFTPENQMLVSPTARGDYTCL